MFTTWQQVVNGLIQQPAGTIARIDAHRIEHPRAAGLTQTFGLPQEQRASFRAQLSDGSVLCVDDFGAVYEARLDRASPLIQKVAPSSANGDNLAAAMGMSALGALVGLALGGSQRGALTGALLGGAFGLGTIAVKEAKTSPATSNAARELAENFARLAVIPSEHIASEQVEQQKMLESGRPAASITGPRRPRRSRSRKTAR